MSRIHVAFYRGRGTAADRLIRHHTRSRYSHVELVWATRTPGPGDAALCLSASLRDGGVRRKVIAFDRDAWSIVPAPAWTAPDAWAWAEREIGKPYDVLGIVLSQGVGLGLHAPGRWFCSELCAHALGLARPSAYSPGALFGALTDRTRPVRMAVGRGRGSVATA